MDIIIQILLFPFVLPIYIYIIYMEYKYEKETKKRRENHVKPKSGIYEEENYSKNGLEEKDSIKHNIK